jgi:hypothetical protein
MWKSREPEADARDVQTRSREAAAADQDSGDAGCAALRDYAGHPYQPAPSKRVSSRVSMR